jgi:glycogen synthase
MRVALVASSYLPRLGGVEQHVRNVARVLAARGHEVEVWTVDQGDDIPPDPAVVVRALPCPLPSRSLRGVLAFVLRWPAAAFAWRRARRRFRPEIIDIQCFGPNGPYAARSAQSLGTGLVYSNHGETFMDATGAFASSLIRSRLQSVLASADAVTSCSRFAAEDLRRFGMQGDVTVVGNGVDPDCEREPLPARPPGRYVAAVGRIVGNKGFAKLIRAYAMLDDPSFALVIAGDGPDAPGLRALATSLGVAERVVFAGRMSPGQVASLLDGALAQVVPSDVEAFGIVVLEGWRSRTAVLVTEHGGPPEFVTDDVDGVLFDPDDLTEFSRELQTITADAEFRERVAAAGHRRVSEFTWEAVADVYERVFAGVDGARSTPHPPAG